jgi:hypothetical protein
MKAVLSIPTGLAGHWLGEPCCALRAAGVHEAGDGTRIAFLLKQRLAFPLERNNMQKTDYEYCRDFNYHHRGYGIVLTQHLDVNLEPNDFVLRQGGRIARAPCAEMREILDSRPRHSWWAGLDAAGYVRPYTSGKWVASNRAQPAVSFS